MFVKGDDIKKTFGKNVAVSSGMQEAIELWQQMFRNKPPWLDENTETLGLAAAVASEIGGRFASPDLDTGLLHWSI